MDRYNRRYNRRYNNRVWIRPGGPYDTSTTYTPTGTLDNTQQVSSKRFKPNPTSPRDTTAAPIAATSAATSAAYVDTFPTKPRSRKKPDNYNPALEESKPQLKSKARKVDSSDNPNQKEEVESATLPIA